MKVVLCYNNSSVKIKWRLPFLPRIGETLSVSEFLSEKQNNELCRNKDYFTIIHIAWFPSKRNDQSIVEIILG
ncbi:MULTISPECIES: hypothetical protein [Chryseobacterium]|jgi:hypothetical protein|uniref:hypothetical protein n=1 Tax=Chryseobacterium TaxID=59732 RepID=UPI001032B2CF|nr:MULTISPECIES: hypothetical protein [Chryseobacterium]QQV01827.1 hypothetical protein I6I61_12100 [Chryseobacterium sp. FDAARGOS 1104]